ncbi:MAG: glycosyltransferase family 9 protein [Gammaproteobacteria bacterium]|nr:glycosyltransferase family 9 protein [Gammaproteobacteria bacterium]
MNNPPEKILVIRNDKLGDFMLSYPSFALLKRAMPECETFALVPGYTREMAEACPWIDHVIIDPGKDSGLTGLRTLISNFRSHSIEAAITLFSTTRIGFALMAAGIPYRLAPATKAAQIFYNHKLTQRRSRSEKPEYEYNMDLIRYFLRAHQCNTDEIIQPPYLQFDEREVKNLKQVFCKVYQLDFARPIIFIHPGSGGSANNLSLEQYRQLAVSLAEQIPVNIVISAGPGELPYAEQLATRLGDLPHTIYHSTEGLKRFAQHIQFANAFISGSTGPLHIAGALNTPTAAFYPRRRSATALRWQTLNSEDKRLAFSPPQSANEHDMSAIDVKAAVNEIYNKFLRP